MVVLNRRFLLAGGVGTLGAIGLDGTASAIAAPVFGSGCIDLGAAPYGVVADQESKALANARAINQAIADHPSGVRLVLPAGAVYVARDPDIVGIYRFAAIRIVGPDKRRLVLSGRGAAVTRIVMTGSQGAGLTQIVQVADGPERITLCDFSIEHGPNASDVDTVKLRNHQIELNAVIADVTDVEIRDVFFGTCIGDAIRLAGGEGDANPTFLRNTTIQHIVMRLGKHPAAPLGCRSGVSFQKGIRDLLLSDFYIVGPKNSCLDMEPTAHGGMDNITITNGTIDNTQGTTWVAASFDGFEDNGNVTSFLTHSRMVNVRIKGGQLQVVSTRGCTLDNIVIDASGGTADAVNSPLLLVYRENEDLAIRNVDIVRDVGCPAGPLATVQHTVTSPRRVTIEGGTWTTRVGPGAELSYVDMLDTTGLRMRGTRIRIEDTLTGKRNGIRFRPGQRDMANIHLDGVAIESPDGLTAGVVFAAINRNITNIQLTDCSLTGAATTAVAFDSSGGFVVDRFPILQGNDFDRCANVFTTDHTAVGAVFPIIAGNRGGQCTLVGTVAPDGTVAARQGTQYIRQNGNAPELWWKVSGTGPTGWKKLA